MYQIVELNRDIIVANYILQVQEGPNNFCHFSKDIILLLIHYLDQNGKIWVISGALLCLTYHNSSYCTGKGNNVRFLSAAKYVNFNFTF